MNNRHEQQTEGKMDRLTKWMDWWVNEFMELHDKMDAWIDSVVDS